MSVHEPFPPAASDGPAVRIEWLFEGSSARVGCWSCQIRDSGLTPARAIAWHQIGFLDRGAFILHAAGKTELMDRSGVLIHRPVGEFRTSHPLGSGDRGSFLAIPHEIFLESLRSDDRRSEKLGAPFLISHGRKSSRAYLRQRRLVQRLRSASPPESVEIEEEALAIVGEAVGDPEAPPANAGGLDGSATALKRRRISEDVKGILADRFRKPQRLAQIAEAVGVSPYHLCRVFRRETGITVHSYLIRLRLRASLGPAGEAGTDLSRLAMDLGFSNHSHFTAAFHREFGISPTDLRRAPHARGMRC